jgi:hypothetical protein
MGQTEAAPRRVNTGALGLFDGKEGEMAVANQAVVSAVREKFHVNTVEVEGIVTRVWDRKGDVFARLAVYDERAEILEPAKDGRLPRRQAHYVSFTLADTIHSVRGSQCSLVRPTRVIAPPRSSSATKVLRAIWTDRFRRTPAFREPKRRSSPRENCTLRPSF